MALALAGCGDSDHKSANDEAGDTPAGDTPAGDTASDGNALADDVLLTLEGKHEVLGGGARLNVEEAQPLVLLTITTVYPNNHDDLILLQLGLDGVEHAMGQHTENLTGGRDAVAVAQAYIAQVSYTSQSGTLDVTLSSDGKLDGHFDAQLTPDDSSTAQPLDISGYFAGKWSLICSSPVPSLPGDHSTPNSAYCKNLTF